MAGTTHPIQTNFTAGELNLDGRVDVARYANGVTKLLNYVCTPVGGALRRPGFRFVAGTKGAELGADPGPGGRVRLIPFEFNAEQAYILELGHKYMRFYANGGRIETTGTPTEIVTPYEVGHLPRLKYVQTADVMILVHPEIKPHQLTRTSHTNWTLTPIEFIDGPYLDMNTNSAITLTPSGTTGAITITSSVPFAPTLLAALDLNKCAPGALIRMKHGTTWGYAVVDVVTSPTQVNATVKSTLGGTTATTDWQLGAWFGCRGFPRTVAFFEERLYFAGTAANPQTIWGSKVGDFYNFTPRNIDASKPIVDDDAVDFTIAANKVNSINWLVGAKQLVIGTIGEEFVLTGSQGKPVTPTSIQVRSDTSYGSADRSPIRSGNAILFVGRSKKRLFELVFNFDQDSYVAPDLSLLANHLFASPLELEIEETAYFTHPFQILWCQRTDGTLLGMTYQRDQDVVGWHQHETRTNQSKSVIESVAVIPHPDGRSDQLWIAVKRSNLPSGTSTLRYIEVQELRDGYYGFFHSDSALVYSGPPATVLSGLVHLNGQTVVVQADGVQRADAVVSGGQITISPAASFVEVGLKYESEIQTLRPEIPLDGTSQGLKKRWAEVIVRFDTAFGGEVNGFDPELDPPPTVQPRPSSKDYRMTHLGWDREGRITVAQRKMYPLDVLAIMGTIAIGDH